MISIITRRASISSGPPMTLGNMRANGVRSLFVYCLCCHHQVDMNVDAYSDSLTVPAFGPRMVCTRCGSIGADARPKWSERITYSPYAIAFSAP